MVHVRNIGGNGGARGHVEFRPGGLAVSIAFRAHINL